jgi:hypothetical protein
MALWEGLGLGLGACFGSLFRAVCHRNPVIYLTVDEVP